MLLCMYVFLSLYFFTLCKCLYQNDKHFSKLKDWIIPFNCYFSNYKSDLGNKYINKWQSRTIYGVLIKKS